MPNRDDDMDKPVTKRELHEALGIFGGALRAELRVEWRAEIREWGHQLSGEIQRWGRQLSAELAQHTNRILEETRRMVGIVDEKYGDLPGRVTVLEARVSAPKRRRAPRRAR